MGCWIPFFRYAVKNILKRRTISVFSRNHPALCFSLKRDGWQRPNNSYVIKLTKTAGGVLQRDCSQKYRNIYRKTLMLESLFHKVTDLQTCDFIRKRLQHRCFLLRNFSKTLLLNIICVELWTDFTKWLFVVLFQNHSDSVILQKYQSLWYQSLKHNSVHMPSLYLTLTLSFEPKLSQGSSWTVTIQKANACSPLNSFFIFPLSWDKNKI